MAKIRKLASIENGLTEVIKILTEDEVEDAIGKGVSYIRKCSDPDQPNQIDHNESLKLDLACIKKNKSPPLLNCHEHKIAQDLEGIKVSENNDLDDVLIRFTILHGKLIEAIELAQDPNSDQGEKISELEKKDIFESIKKIEDKIMKLKISIDNQH